MNGQDPLAGVDLRRGILVDTNLLLLAYVGAFDPAMIATFHRTRQFDLADFSLLNRVVGRFSRVVATPHILAEVPNLLGQCPSHQRTGLFSKYASGIGVLEEVHVDARTVAETADFARFGLTDLAILHVAAKTCLVLSVDWKLCGYLRTNGVEVLNFNHLRQPF